MKTTQRQFKEFKDAFLFWQKEFGCMDFDVAFELTHLKGAVAQIKIDVHGKLALIELADEMNDPMDVERFAPGEHAKHEALHLLLRRATSLTSQMGVSSREIDDCEEGLVRVLERLL